MNFIESILPNAAGIPDEFIEATIETLFIAFPIPRYKNPRINFNKIELPKIINDQIEKFASLFPLINVFIEL